MTLKESVGAVQPLQMAGTQLCSPSLLVHVGFGGLGSGCAAVLGAAGGDPWGGAGLRRVLSPVPFPPCGPLGCGTCCWLGFNSTSDVSIETLAAWLVFSTVVWSRSVHVKGMFPNLE